MILDRSLYVFTKARCLRSSHSFLKFYLLLHYSHRTEWQYAGVPLLRGLNASSSNACLILPEIEIYFEVLVPFFITRIIRNLHFFYLHPNSAKSGTCLIPILNYFS